MVTLMLVVALAVFAAMILRANDSAAKREQVRVPIYIENLYARRRRRE